MPNGGATSSDDLEAGLPTGGPEAAPGGEAAVAAAATAAAAAGRRRGRAGNTGPRGEAVTVTWDERLRRPAGFVWRRRHYRVERVLETWIVETGWWKDEGPVSRWYWRVRAGGRVFDLRYDRVSKAWALAQALN